RVLDGPSAAAAHGAAHHGAPGEFDVLAGLAGRLDGDGQRGRAEGGRARGQGVLPGDQLGDDVAALAAAGGGGDDLAVDVGEGDGGVADRGAVGGDDGPGEAARAAEDDVQFDGAFADGDGDRLRLVAACGGDQDVRTRAGRGQGVPAVVAAGAPPDLPPGDVDQGERGTRHHRPVGVLDGAAHGDATGVRWAGRGGARPARGVGAGLRDGRGGV